MSYILIFSICTILISFINPSEECFEIKNEGNSVNKKTSFINIDNEEIKKQHAAFKSDEIVLENGYYVSVDVNVPPNNKVTLVVYQLICKGTTDLLISKTLGEKEIVDKPGDHHLKKEINLLEDGPYSIGYFEIHVQKSEQNAEDVVIRSVTYNKNNAPINNCLNLAKYNDQQLIDTTFGNHQCMVKKYKEHQCFNSISKELLPKIYAGKSFVASRDDLVKTAIGLSVDGNGVTLDDSIVKPNSKIIANLSTVENTNKVCIKVIRTDCSVTNKNVVKNLCWLITHKENKSFCTLEMDMMNQKASFVGQIHIAIEDDKGVKKTELESIQYVEPKSDYVDSIGSSCDYIVMKY